MSNFLKYFRNYKKEAVLGPVFKLLEACFELFVPLVIANIVDTIIPHGNQGDLVAMVLLLALLAVVGVIVALTAQYFSAKAAVGYTKELTNDLYQKVLSLPKSSQDQISGASLLTRLSSDTLQIQTGINIFLRLFLRAPIVVFGAFIMAFSISPRLSMIFLVMIGVLFAIVTIISKVSSALYHKLRLRLDSLVGVVRENSMGMRVIRAFGQKNREISDFTEQNQDYKGQQIHAGYWSALLTPTTFLVVNIALIVLIWRGQLAIADNLIGQGMLVALINYLLQILVELVKMVMVVASLNQTYISFQRVKEVFEQPSEDLNAPLERQVSEDAAAIFRAQNLSFTYPSAKESALENLNFTIPKNSFFGIIGGTGSGKSTLTQLFCLLYPVTKGNVSVYVNGKNPDNLAIWRKQFALVPQKAELFSGTVRSNLMLGLENISDEKIWWALEIAQAKDFIQEKDGLDTKVEAFGRNFSGGQRQRLTIARAILQEAPILILDDSTSALDYLTESRLLSAIHDQLPEQTLIMISQRTNSLRSADQILVLDKGKQVGLGSHTDLLEHCPVYREIDQSQHSKEVRA